VQQQNLTEKINKMLSTDSMASLSAFQAKLNDFNQARLLAFEGGPAYDFESELHLLRIMPVSIPF
jgi:hypothetical protein